jgi:hypothetical protein
VDGGRRLVREAREVGPSADRLELFAPLERLRDRDDVDRLATLEQLEDRREDRAVRLAVEVRRTQELRDLDDASRSMRMAPSTGLLGLEDSAAAGRSIMRSRPVAGVL